MSGDKRVVIEEIAEAEPQEIVPELIDDDDESDDDDFSVETDDSENDSDDDEAEEEADNLGSLFQYFFTNDNGENVADILTSLKDSIDTHNKLIYKLLQNQKK